ncbi:hypothetical protein EDB80DRAFT_267586 [Ilyonectria destructans]|nr:hypothetical protein EDB80DRAFT_267586 [Ilyonectria destructans]
MGSQLVDTPVSPVAGLSHAPTFFYVTWSLQKRLFFLHHDKNCFLKRIRPFQGQEHFHLYRLASLGWMENKTISKNTFSEPQGEYDEIFPDGEVIKSIRDEARPSLQNTINRQALLCSTESNMPPRAGLVFYVAVHLDSETVIIDYNYPQFHDSVEALGDVGVATFGVESNGWVCYEQFSAGAVRQGQFWDWTHGLTQFNGGQSGSPDPKALIHSGETSTSGGLTPHTSTPGIVPLLAAYLLVTALHATYLPSVAHLPMQPRTASPPASVFPPSVPAARPSQKEIGMTFIGNRSNRHESKSTINYYDTNDALGRFEVKLQAGNLVVIGNVYGDILSGDMDKINCGGVEYSITKESFFDTKDTTVMGFHLMKDTESGNCIYWKGFMDLRVVDNKGMPVHNVQIGQR